MSLEVRRFLFCVYCFDIWSTKPRTIHILLRGSRWDCLALMVGTIYMWYNSNTPSLWTGYATHVLLTITLVLVAGIIIWIWARNTLASRRESYSPVQRRACTCLRKGRDFEILGMQDAQMPVKGDGNGLEWVTGTWKGKGGEEDAVRDSCVLM